MTAALTSKNNSQDKSSQNGAGRKARTTSERLEQALSMSAAADIELKALFRGINDEFGRMDIIYPNY